MHRTLLVLALVLVSAVAAATAAFRRGSTGRPPEATLPGQPALPASRRDGGLRISAQLERRYLDLTGGGEAFLEVNLAADGASEAGARVPVNAVLVLDRSGSMSGEKIERAKDAARALVQALDGEDRLAIVDFASDARVLVPSTAMTAAAKERALSRIALLQATSGTNLGAALDLAGPELLRGRAPFRIDKVFIASDGQANEGVSDRQALLELSRRDLGPATVSTFGIGEDYDEELMTSLAAQAGGRARFISRADELLPAVRAELTRASQAVARNVRLEVRGAGGAKVLRVLGYEADAGWVRLPDFAAGEERRVLVKLSLPRGQGQVSLARLALQFDDASGERHVTDAAAGATFTAERALLDEAPTAAAYDGARAELAFLAGNAAHAREGGLAQEAEQAMRQMKEVASKASAAAPPAQAAALQAEVEGYDESLRTISGMGGAASNRAGKKVKQQAFDAVRAPVKGW